HREPIELDTVDVRAQRVQHRIPATALVKKVGCRPIVLFVCRLGETPIEARPGRRIVALLGERESGLERPPAPRRWRRIDVPAELLRNRTPLFFFGRVQPSAAEIER